MTVGAAVLGAALLLAGCTSGGTAATAQATTTGSYGYLSTGPSTDYTFPLSADSQVNETFQYQLYRPLYWIGGKGNGAPLFNPQLSVADPPVFSDGGKIVTVHLKHYIWSDGKPVTSRDVQFFMNLVKAEKSYWGAYVPGYFPDNIAATDAPTASTVVFHLTRSFGMNSAWFLYNELSQITPLPRQIWDKTSPNGAIGNFDKTHAGASKVWNFLEAQTVDLSTYDTNPLWQVVDGPWRLKSFTQDGQITLVPNKRYSGPDKPTLKVFQELPFATATAALNSLLASKSLDLTSVPLEDIKSETQALKADGYKIARIAPWAINYFPLNFHNATFGPIISQLYVRQAFQSLIDQPTYIKAAFDGYATPTYGPVPLAPPSPFTSAAERTNPYPYNPRRAVDLLRSHGWTVKPGGVTVCAHAGSGAGQCGKGVPRGATMQFTLEYSSGSTSQLNELQFVAGDFTKAGIQLTLRPTNNLNYNACQPKQSSCSWQLVQGGTSWTYFPDVYPTGGEIFSTGAIGNPGSYSNPVVNRLVSEAHRGGLAALHKLESYEAAQLPDLWLPVVSNVVVYKANMKGIVPEDSLGNVYPSTWRFGK
ncbi:MAG: ABC transporter substrate-binding protein [Acidimicrobiales bacterium]